MSDKYFKLGNILNEKENILKSAEFKKYIRKFLTTDLSRPQIESFLFSLIYGNDSAEILIEKHDLKNESFVKEYIDLFNQVKNDCKNSGVSETNMKCFLHANINELLLFEFL